MLPLSDARPKPESIESNYKVNSGCAGKHSCAPMHIDVDDDLQRACKSAMLAEGARVLERIAKAEASALQLFPLHPAWAQGAGRVREAACLQSAASPRRHQGFHARAAPRRFGSKCRDGC